MNPAGNIIRKEGESIEINCTLDSPEYSINDLKFSFSKREVQHEIIVITFFHQFFFCLSFTCLQLNRI